MGGEYNDSGEFLLLRQSDAHAWSEVWLADRGWVRVDPTSAVAPERVFNQIAVEEAGFGVPVVFRSKDPGMVGALVRGIGRSLDAVNARWHMWVLGYDSQRENRLLGWVGLGSLDRVGIGVVMVVLCGTAILVLGVLLASMRTRRERDPLVDIYRLFCRRLGRIGFTRKAWEGPSDYARRVEQARPDLGRTVKKVVELYCRLRYSGRGTPKQLQELKALVKGFRPARIST